MPLLAALASFLFPGAGQAFVGRTRPVVGWAVVGFLPIAAGMVWPPAVWALLAIRIGAAVHAGLVVRRERPGRAHLTAAGVAAGAQAIALILVQAFVLEAYAPSSTSMAPTLVIGDHLLVDKLTPHLGGYARGDIVVFDHPLGYRYVKRIAAVGGDTISIERGVLYVNGTAAARTLDGRTSYWDLIAENGDDWREQSVLASEETLDGRTYRVFQAPDQAAPGPWSRDFPVVADGDDPCARATASQPGRYGRAPRYAQPPLTLTADGRSCRVPADTFFMLGDNRDNSNDSRSWGVVPRAEVIGRVIGIWWARSTHTGTDASRLGRIN